MKVTTYLVIIGLLISNIGLAQTSWSEVSPSATPIAGVERDIVPQVIPAEGVDFYNDEALLLGACPIAPTLTVEDWSAAGIPPGNFCDGTPPLNSLTNDACFSAGNVVAGLEMNTIDAGGSGNLNYVQLGSGFLGIPSDAVGPITFADHTMLSFSVPSNLVSFEFVSPLTDGVLDIEVFGASGSLGTTSVSSNGNTPVFVGALASENITSVTIQDGGSIVGELFTKISFGLCESDMEIVPTMGEWGIICLGMIMLIFGAVSVGQRQTTIA